MTGVARSSSVVSAGAWDVAARWRSNLGRGWVPPRLVVDQFRGGGVACVAGTRAGRSASLS